MDHAKETRMAAKAVADGVEAVPLVDGAYATRSTHTADGLHYVTTVAGCTCPGWTGHGHCKHVAYVRRLTRDDDVVIAVAVLDAGDAVGIAVAIDPPVCGHCGGDGFVDFRSSIGPYSKHVIRARCLHCRPRPPDPWKYHS